MVARAQQRLPVSVSCGQSRDYLAVPSTSTPAERAFSRGGELVDGMRDAPRSVPSPSGHACVCRAEQSWVQDAHRFDEPPVELQRNGAGFLMDTPVAAQPNA